VRELPTFPRVTLARPSLWRANSGLSALNWWLCGASLCSPFSNFRFGMPETGSIYDGDRFVGPAYRESRATWHEVCGTNDGGIVEIKKSNFQHKVTFASIGSTIISCLQTRAWPGRDRQQAGGCPVCLRAKPQLSFPKVRWVRPEVLVDEIKKSNHRRLPGPAPHRKKLCAQAGNALCCQFALRREESPHVLLLSSALRRRSCCRP